MTSSNPSECPQCSGPLTFRQAHGYPVVSQVIFGISFLAFLFSFERVRSNALLLWCWTGFQIAVGVLLVRGRMRARHRVLHCIRCGRAIP